MHSDITKEITSNNKGGEHLLTGQYYEQRGDLFNDPVILWTKPALAPPAIPVDLE